MRRKNNVVTFLPRKQLEKSIISTEEKCETISSQISNDDDQSLFKYNNRNN